MQDATETIERLRIVKDIPREICVQEKAQAKAADLLTAVVNLIGKQVAHFAILKNRTTLERKFGSKFEISSRLIVVAQVLVTLCEDGERGVYANAQKALEKGLSDFNQCLHDAGLLISIGTPATTLFFFFYLVRNFLRSQGLGRRGL